MSGRKKEKIMNNFTVLKQSLIIGLLSFSLANNRYSIDINYSPDSLFFSARQEIQFTNNTDTDLENIVLHIYDNKKLTRMDIAHNDYANFKNGYIEPQFQIEKLNIDKQNARYSIEGSDQTVLNISLNHKLKVGEKTNIILNYNGTLPYMEARYGKFEHLSHFSFFYPILSVYNPTTGWSKNPYSLKGQAFYSDVADYRVNITVPKNEVIAAPGELVSVITSKDTKTESYVANSIRSFHFSSSSLLKKASRKTKDGILLNTYYFPTMKNASKYVLDYAEESVDFYENKYGKYPYKSLTILPGNLVHAGEEFPGIILISKKIYKDAPNALFGGLLYQYRILEIAVAHEIGHQWWNVTVGNDQYSQPWLDEGLTEYSTMLYMENKYGKDSNLIDLPHVWNVISGSYKGTDQSTLRENTYRDNIYNFANVLSQNIDQYYDISDYFNTVYSKGPLVVKMFHNLVGDDYFYKTMQSYLKQYYMKNASINDFIAVAESVCNQNLKHFFKQWLTTTAVCDYALGNWESKPVKYGYQNKIEIISKEGITVPMDVEICYENNKKEIITISNNTIETQLNLTSAEKIKSIQIDPQNKIMEKEELNNASEIKNIETSIFNLAGFPNNSYFLSYSMPYIFKYYLNPIALSMQEKHPSGLSFGKRDQYITLGGFPGLNYISYYQQLMDTKGSIFSYQIDKDYNDYFLYLKHEKYVPIYVMDQGIQYIELAKQHDISLNKNFNSSYYDLGIFYDFFPGLIPMSLRLTNNPDQLDYTFATTYFLTNNPVAKLGIKYKSEGTASSNISGTGLCFEYNGYDDAFYVSFIPVALRHNNNTPYIFSITLIKNLFVSQFFNIKGEYSNSNSSVSTLYLNHELSIPLYFSILNDDIAIDNIRYTLSQEYYTSAELLINISYIYFDVGFFNSPIIPFKFSYDHDLKEFAYGLSFMF